MTSSPVRGAAGHDAHGHGAQAEDPNVYTKESFMNPTWRNTLIAGTLAYLAYSFLPTPPSTPTSPSSSSTYNQPAEDLPYLSKLLARITTPAEEWKRRNAKHLEQTVRSAEDRLLFQEAERPRVYRMKNPAYFDTLPPHRRPVGDDVNLSDLVVKNDPALPEVRQ